MNTSAYRKPIHLFAGAALACLLAMAPARLLADEVSDIQSAGKQATSDYNDAEAAAKQAMKDTPLDKTQQDAENGLDKAEQNRDDLPDKATQKQKDDADKAVEKAQTKADDAANGKDTSDIRKALKKRRDARKKLKAAVAKLTPLLVKQKGLDESVWSVTEKILRAAQQALRKAEGPVTVSMVLPRMDENSLAMLASEGKVKVETVGTGKTIGHVADLKIENVTDAPLTVAIPSMVLESRSRKNQDYACPHPQTATVGPHDTATVPVNGVCLARSLPPAGKDSGDDLIVSDGSPSVPAHPDSHYVPADTRELARVAESYYKAADDLEKRGQLDKIPYHDPQMKKDIVVQWGLWSDPRVAQTCGGTPATKEDLRKVVYKQIEQNGQVTAETKKKADLGIDTIFEKVQLTSEKAKDLQQPDPYGGPIEVSGDQTGTQTKEGGETPKTGEKPKKLKVKKGKDGKWPKPIQDWWDKYKAAKAADVAKKKAAEEYQKALWKYQGRSAHWQELLKKAADAAENAKKPDATEQDKNDDKKAQNELQKLELDLEKDFQETPEGKDLHDKTADANKASTEANKDEKEAGKDLDQTTKDKVEQTEKEEADKAAKQPVQAKW